MVPKFERSFAPHSAAYSFGWWLMLICSERKVVSVDC
jgi:hypothetical protein